MDFNYRRIYTHEYLVKTDNDLDHQGVVLSQSMSTGPDPVPALWDNYHISTGTAPDDADVYLQRKEIRRMVDDGTERRSWIVTCIWTPPEPGNNSGEPPTENPLLRPVRYSLEWASKTKIAEKDKDGNPMVNSAGDKFDPPVEVDDARPVLVATKNMDGDNLGAIIALAIEYKNAVNTGSFFGAGTRQAKVESITSGDLMEENGFRYYAVVFRIQFDSDTWDFSIVDKGTQVLEVPEGGGDMVKVWPRVKVATETAKVGDLLDEVNLEPDGTMRDPSLPALFKEPAYRYYPEKDFSGLGIGGT